MTKIATPPPLLPTFAPDCACEIENASATEKTCLVRAAPDQVYACARALLDRLDQVSTRSAGGATP
ncbi:MAG TPA: hypothetical protein PLC98_23045 [Anaerolineales bacterium]|nr:hypothetical protein [Anaerolineales bacterium]